MTQENYPFKPLELGPFPGIDCSEIGIKGTFQLYPMEKSTSSAINSLPEYEPDKIKSRPAFSTSSAAYYPGGNGSSSELQNSFIPTSSLQRKRKRFATTWSIAVLSVIASACAVFYSHRVMVNQNALPSFLESQPGTTVLVVNILSHLVAFLCWSLFTDTMEALRWALACRPQGILLTSFLAMSRATPIAGAIYLCLTKGAHQIWSIQRYALSYNFLVEDQY